MKVSTFQAKDMREALQAVKQALGPDAVILSTRYVKERKNGFLSGQTLIEVTACPNPATQETGRAENRDHERVESREPPSGRVESREPVSSRFDHSQGRTPRRVEAKESAPSRLNPAMASRFDAKENSGGRPEAPARFEGREREGSRFEPRKDPYASGMFLDDSFGDELFDGQDDRVSLTGMRSRKGEELPKAPPAQENSRLASRQREEAGGRFDGADNSRLAFRQREEAGGRFDGADNSRLASRQREDSSGRFESGDNSRLASRQREEAGGRMDPILASDLSTIRNTLAQLEEQVTQLPEVMARELQKSPAIPGLDAEGQQRYGWLMMHGVEEPIARQVAMLERAGPERGMEAVMRRLLKFNDPLSGESRVIALVGPTGVGKTTTLAKMAAELILNRRRMVGMITLDTFRVGAVAQLETYAKLLQLRLVVARNPTELKAGMLSLGRCEYILVDTVGTSPYNERQVASTAELLPTLGAQREVLLCMAGNVRETEQRAIFRRFQVLQPTGLVFTKLDETVTYGGILNVALRAHLPLTVFTDGQRVPENLGWLSPQVMARWFEEPKES